MLDHDFTFEARLWVYTGKGAWHFITLPTEIGEAIRFFAPQAKGFRPVAVEAKIGQTKWKTSVFPDSKSKSFLLAVKKDVRQAEGIGDGDEVKVRLCLKS